MDLKSGYPYWAVKNGLMHAFPQLDADLACDVVVVGGGITEAEGTVGTPYGVIKAAWKIADGEMTMTVAVPVGTECTTVLLSGEEKVLGSGEYTVTAKP